MRLPAIVLAFAFLSPSVVAAEGPAAPTEGPVALRTSAWLSDAQAIHARILAERDDLPSEYRGAWAVLARPNATEDLLGLPGAYAYFLAVADYVDARENVTIDYRFDGRAGCTGNSSCARFLALADAAAADAEAALAASRTTARAAWSDVERAPGLESAFVAASAQVEAARTLDGYAAARERVTGLRSYDPSSASYEHLLVAAWVAAYLPLRLAALADELVAASNEADLAGAVLDQARLEEATASLAADLPPGDANASAPEVAGAFFAHRARLEYDRLLFMGSSDDGPRILRARVAELMAVVEGLEAEARALGYGGFVHRNMLALAGEAAARPQAGEGDLARVASALVAVEGLHTRLLVPSAAAASVAPQPHEGGSGAVAAAVATAGALALVGAAALLLRRKP